MITNVYNIKDNVTNEIVGYKFENTYIRVYKNHEYESKHLKKDKNYIFSTKNWFPLYVKSSGCGL